MNRASRCIPGPRPRPDTPRFLAGATPARFSPNSAIVCFAVAARFSAGLAAVLVLTILNLLLRPILLVLTLPLIVLSLGLFLVVLNALLLELTAYMVKGFSLASFWSAVGGALVISVVTAVLNFTMADRRHAEVRTSEPRHPKIINPPE